MSNVVVIGGGPAGLMVALSARKNGNNVTVLEKNSCIGKKLSITGKGRCNVTYDGDNQKFLDNVVTNSKFLMSSINSFNNKDLLEFLESIDVKTKLERGNRFFLKSDNALELCNKLSQKLKKEQIKVLTCSTVKSITKKEEEFCITLENGKKLKADVCIVATGGKSYTATGSTGDGYNIAKSFGHSINKIKPALVPMKCYEVEECMKMQGLTLKNVSIKVYNVDSPKKKIYEDFGEMLFTHFGITGPIVLSASSKINSLKDIEESLTKGKLKFAIDLKPALEEDVLYKRIGRDFDKYANKEFKNSLNDLLPKSIIPIVISRSKINENKKVNQITKEEKQKLVSVIKSFEFTLKELMPVETGIVTSGGVNTKEIDPKTMESKLVKNLYFAGEVIDVDAYTGGYNLQIAFSTGYIAGSNIF